MIVIANLLTMYYEVIIQKLQSKVKGKGLGFTRCGSSYGRGHFINCNNIIVRCLLMKLAKLILSIILLLLVINLTTSSFLDYDVISVISYNLHKDTYSIVVDLDDHVLYLYNKGELEKKYPVSGGKYTTPSPLGTWTIVSKADWGEGFGGTWMGFNVPWGKYGIHGTDEPWSIGSPLSKGCIRMFNKDAAELKKTVYAGTKVTIIKGPYGAFGEGFRTLKPGAIGSDVYAVQKRLQELGYYNGWVDGKFGVGMQSAVSKFQKDKGLPQTKYINARFYNALGMELFE